VVHEVRVRVEAGAFAAFAVRVRLALYLGLLAGLLGGLVLVLA